MGDQNMCNVCNRKASQKCSGCQIVFYCCKEHQTTDWKNHKKNCQPFKISSNSLIGRYLVATRDIKRNEIILKEKPLLYGPPQETVPICLGCHQELFQNNYTTCTKCGWPMCCQECENSPCHVPECYYTKKCGKKISVDKFGSPNTLYQCITVLRCLYQREHNPKLWKKINMLESHCDERKSTRRYYNEELMATQLIMRLFQLEQDFDLDEILRICGIIMVNAHEVPLSEPPYIAIYEKTSMFENDCSANCSKSFTNNGRILISAGTDIKMGDHLSICYADPLWNTVNRRNFLHETKFFWCSCRRCSDLTEFQSYFSAVGCQNSKCDGYLLPKTFLTTENQVSNWSCSTCSYSVDNNLVSTLIDKVSNDINSLDKTNIDKCKAFLNKLRKILPANNFLMVDVKLALSQVIGQTSEGLSIVSNEDLELKRSLCKELLDLTENLIPSEKRVRGLVAFDLHASLVELAKRKCNKFVKIEESQLILKESRAHLLQCIELLRHEPESLPEGQVFIQAVKNLHDISVMIDNYKE